MGDTDGDGHDDVAVGAPLATSLDTKSQDCARGRLRIYSGADGSTLASFYAVHRKYCLGSAVAGAGDMDGDGLADVAAGASAWLNGSALFLSGPSGYLGTALDLDDVPVLGAAMSGETWHLQAWYRDANPTPTSNFTGSVLVPFQ